MSVDVTERSDDHVRARVTSARADAPATVPLSGLESGRTTFHELRVTPESEDAEPRFFLDATTASPSDAVPLPSDETLGFLRVKPTYVENSELASLTLRFRVPADEASRGEVTLYRYRDGEWTPLETERVGDRAGTHAFRATASGASLFAVGATNEETTVTTATGTNSTAGNGTTAETPTSTNRSALADDTRTATRSVTTADESGSVPGFGPVAALVALAAAALGARRRE